MASIGCFHFLTDKGFLFLDMLNGGCLYHSHIHFRQQDIFLDPILQTAFEIGKRSKIALSCVCESILFLAWNPTITKVGVDSPLFPESKVQ